MNETPRQYVYRCWDADDRLLYVGCSQYPMRRLFKEHAKGSAWFERMDEYSIDGPFGYYEGFAVERAAIETEAPEFNVRWRVS